MTRFSIDPENLEFYLLYLGYNLNEILDMEIGSAIRMGKRIQMLTKLGSIHSYVNMLGQQDDSKLKVQFPSKWLPGRQQKFKNEYSIEFDISDVIIEP